VRGVVHSEAAMSAAETPPGTSSLTVTTVRHGPEGPGAPLVETFDAMPGESVAIFLIAPPPPSMTIFRFACGRRPWRLRRGRG
jgi:hypothetical protein